MASIMGNFVTSAGLICVSTIVVRRVKKSVMSGIPVVKESRGYLTCAIALQRQEQPSDKISRGFLIRIKMSLSTGK
jgi:hypothetical protein